MKKHLLVLVFFSFGVWFTFVSCNSKKEAEFAAPTASTGTLLYSALPVDSLAINAFYQKYPKLKGYQKQVMELYASQQFTTAWYDKKGLIEFANTLYTKYGQIEEEGVQAKFPYENDLNTLFDGHSETNASPENNDVLLSNLYFFYADKVYNGIDQKVTQKIGWLLPRKEIGYANLLDSIILHPKKALKENELLFSQYGKLRSFLQKYRSIEKKGGWESITVDSDFKSFKLGDSAQAIKQIRSRLFLTDDIKTDSKSPIYDEELQKGILNYMARNGFKEDVVILPKHIKAMNLPIGERIQQIMVNMERCRWISPDLEKANEYIMVNIPSYYLYFNRGGQKVFDSPVVVGKAMNKTVIFSGKMSYIVFSPYWNVPTSIIKKEVKPGMAKNSNYLAKHNMEWNNGAVRQKPGNSNSLGLVKFIFPNSNNIYLHDTPSKGLFANEDRAYSHGCIRVGKPRDLAIKILENDKAWTPQKIDMAMHKGKENTYVLKNKIPVYIGYFTAVVKDDGQIYFYKDVYERDQRLANLIYKEE
jgi:murein L,D-transpeptidase YcbB/YkuD